MKIFRQDFRGILGQAFGLLAIFDRFKRVSNNGIIGGLGLGLFIVKQIIEGHNGDIRITSEMNKGSCFSINLPKDAPTHLT